jgi:hypothetical protein
MIGTPPTPPPAAGHDLAELLERAREFWAARGHPNLFTVDVLAVTLHVNINELCDALGGNPAGACGAPAPPEVRSAVGELFLHLLLLAQELGVADVSRAAEEHLDAQALEYPQINETHASTADDGTANGGH